MKCPYCGLPLGDTAEKCPRCKAVVPVEPKKQKPKKEAKKNA